MNSNPTSANYPELSGFWTWDVKRNRVYGDANLAEYFGLTIEELASGAALERYLAAIFPDDRARVAAAIQRCVALCSDFQEEYRVRTMSRGVRRIMAVGHCYRDDNGDPAHYPGWFVDITEHELSGMTALRLAAHHAKQARDAAKSAHHNLVAYLLDNVLEEIQTILDAEDGPGRRIMKT
jgi:hypothetical protein